MAALFLYLKTDQSENRVDLFYLNDWLASSEKDRIIWKSGTLKWSRNKKSVRNKTDFSTSFRPY